MPSTHFARNRQSLLRRAIGLLPYALVALAPSGAWAGEVNRGMEPIHQPVVTRTDFVFDAAADGSGKLSSAERGRVLAWFNAVDMGFGDRVSLADEGNYDYPALRDAIGSEVARYGLLLTDQAPKTAGVGVPGTVRIVISRATAQVRGCPDWHDTGEPNRHGGNSANYGCAMARNFAAMVADPQDLVEGRTTRTILRTATSSMAIRVYVAKDPTGVGGLKTESTGGR